MNVYLDDIRPCPSGFHLARTAKECIDLIQSGKGKLQTLSLDYNLGLGNPTGYTVAQYIVDNNTYAKQIIIHSANPFGRMKMFKLLHHHKPKHVKLSIRPASLFLA
ncbi:cyclic-phosphate processing receiver domain-containing protein [Paenibacillus cremeus]|uniref:Cell division protein FtsJ n=1 Tax=Paenibacillus cremeus TaxID=2163881 RepID=A0A559K557_9BACL|nr:cyclic-phosphate processing receiver domain-containing protein [Paenibacillus cremeus]TVY07237.1 cell division protein FtsJ [Paenibacillus cremeus]